MVSFNQDHCKKVKISRKGKLRVTGGRKTVLPTPRRVTAREEWQVAEASLVYECFYKLRQIA